MDVFRQRERVCMDWVDRQVWTGHKVISYMEFYNFCKALIGWVRNSPQCSHVSAMGYGECVTAESSKIKKIRALK